MWFFRNWKSWFAERRPRNELVWVRLHRVRTASWLEVHIEIKPEARRALLIRLQKWARQAFPGWEVSAFCMQEFLGPDGRPE